MGMAGVNPLSGADFGSPGGGYSTLGEIADLNKALEAGAGIAVGGSTGGTALRVQSLDRTLHTLDFELRHCRMMNSITKKKARSTVEEYTQELGYGGSGDGFIPEIASPGASVSSFERKVATVKFMAVTREVSLPLTMVETVTPAEAREARNGTKLLMELAEAAVFEGDSTKNPLAWDGIGTLIENWAAGHPNDSDLVMDLRGEPLTPEALEDATERIASKFGIANEAYLPTGVYADLAKQLHPNGRFAIGEGARADTFGLKLTKYESQSGGVIDLRHHLLLERNKIMPTSAVGEGAPATPTVTVAAGSNSASQLEVTTYNYCVVALGQNGISAPSTAVSQAVNASQDIDLTIVNPAGVIYYRIYRSTDGVNYYYLDSVVAGSGATTAYNDAGALISGTSTAYVWDNTGDKLAFYQLTDVVKFDLAFVGTAKRFMILMYGVPILHNPRHFVKIKNVGRYVVA